MEPIADLVLDEGKWLAVAMVLATLMAGLWARRARPSGLSPKARCGAVLSLLFAGTIGVMGVGHLLALTLKLVRTRAAGTGLESDLPAVVLYVIGLALVGPAAWLAGSVWRSARTGELVRGRLVGLNLALAGLLVALGLHNAPLAVPGALTAVYLASSRPWVGRSAAALAALVYVGLFVGAVAFFLSGQSFEEFIGL